MDKAVCLAITLKLQNHLWCPNNPRGSGIDDDDDDYLSNVTAASCIHTNCKRILYPKLPNVKRYHAHTQTVISVSTLRCVKLCAFHTRCVKLPSLLNSVAYCNVTCTHKLNTFSLPSTLWCEAAACLQVNCQHTQTVNLPHPLLSMV